MVKPEQDFIGNLYLTTAITLANINSVINLKEICYMLVITNWYYQSSIMEPAELLKKTVESSSVVTVSSKQDKTYITVFLPAVPKENINITTGRTSVIVKAKRGEYKTKLFNHLSQNIEHIIALDFELKSYDKITANHNDGLLVIVIDRERDKTINERNIQVE